MQVVRRHARVFKQKGKHISRPQISPLLVKQATVHFTDSHSQRDPADDTELAHNQRMDRVRRRGWPTEGAQTGTATGKGRQTERASRPEQPLHEPNARGTQW